MLQAKVLQAKVLQAKVLQAKVLQKDNLLEHPLALHIVPAPSGQGTRVLGRAPLQTFRKGTLGKRFRPFGKTLCLISTKRAPVGCPGALVGEQSIVKPNRLSDLGPPQARSPLLPLFHRLSGCWCGNVANNEIVCRHEPEYQQTSKKHRSSRRKEYDALRIHEGRPGSGTQSFSSRACDSSCYLNGSSRRVTGSISRLRWETYYRIGYARRISRVE